MRAIEAEYPVLIVAAKWLTEGSPCFTNFLIAFLNTFCHGTKCPSVSKEVLSMPSKFTSSWV